MAAASDKTGHQVDHDYGLSSRRAARQHPRRTLLLAFLAWKGLLLLIASLPGLLFVSTSGAAVGYDTSTDLAFQLEWEQQARVLGGNHVREDASWSDEAKSSLGLTLALRLTRWDAIYFVNIARRGYVFEQEWAFGAGLPWSIAGIGKGVYSIICSFVVLHVFPL